jgi:predicted acylesterase/phospholipase RssA
MGKNKIHLVCSSGGVKCFSYIGAVKELYRNNVEITSISACSMGSIMGALIASGIDINEIEKKIINFNFSFLKTKKKFSCFYLLAEPFATYHTPNYEQIMIYLLGEDLTLSQLKIPFSALALDVRQKRFLVYSTETHPNMKISEVVKIATSIPLMYEAYKFDKRLLVDAAVATESPVWMAVNRQGNYPIIVLKASKLPTIDYKKNAPKYIGHLFNVAAESHDYFASSQITRNIEIEINCGDIKHDNFKLKQEEIENLISQGEKATQQQLKEFNYNFNHILNFENKFPIEEIGNSPNTYSNTESDATNKAANLADSMITSFKNELYNRNQIFVSYSHLDKEWLRKLNTSLSALERFAGIKAWSDTSIKVGDDWNAEITKALSSTKVALFLVTPNFLHSNFIVNNELNYFLEINKTEKIPIVWVAISSSMYEITPLKDIQCANNPATPLDTLSEADQNIEITKICKKIMDLMSKKM